MWGQLSFTYTKVHKTWIWFFFLMYKTTKPSTLDASVSYSPSPPPSHSQRKEADMSKTRTEVKIFTLIQTFSVFTIESFLSDQGIRDWKNPCYKHVDNLHLVQGTWFFFYIWFSQGNSGEKWWGEPGDDTEWPSQPSSNHSPGSSVQLFISR